MDNKISSGEPINEIEALKRLTQQVDFSAQYYGAWWLGRMRSKHPSAVPLLLSALTRVLSAPQEPDDLINEKVGVARNAARALGKLKAKVAVADLIKALDHPDHSLREAAARSLGELGDKQALSALVAHLQLRGAGEPVGNSLHLGEPCEALLEAIGQICVMNGLKADQDFQKSLERFQHHNRPVVASAACRALLQISGNSKWGEKIVALLKNSQLLVRRAALLDLAACGWRPAAEQIATCRVENSLKLYALRGLLEESPDNPGPVQLGEREKQLLALMDQLL